MEKIAKKLTRKPKVVVAAAVALLIACLFGAVATRINYDILTYVPHDLDSSKGEKLLEDPFRMAATTMLIVEDMPPEYTSDLRARIEEVPGVSSALWISSITGVQLPTNMLPEEMRDIFYSGDSTMMIIQYESPGASVETMKAIDEVRSICSERCFLAGFSAILTDTKALVDHELPLYVGLAIVLSFAAMCLTMESWVLPAVFLLSIGMAIIYNFGTNIFLGEISYVTKAIAAVLQLGVTMDYSIFLYNRYKEEQANYDDKRDAMAAAIHGAFLSLFGSALTTIAGFAALCFMRLLLGRDIGIVMAKGVVLGILTVLTVLPSMLLLFDKQIEKRKHKVIRISFKKLNSFFIKHNKAVVVLFILLFIPAIYSQGHAEVYYKLDEGLPQEMPAMIATTKLKDEFNMASTHFIVMRDDIPYYVSTEMLGKIEDVEGVEAVIAYDKFVDNTIPSFFVPKELTDICKKDGMQVVMINSSYETASKEVAKQVDEINSIIKSYDENAYMTGEAVLTKDLVSIADKDFKVTSYISIAAILLIVGITFKSVSVPIVLVAAIELAIFINQGASYFTGEIMPFIAPTVIGCVQLGATVDYAILMTTRFREELRKGKDRVQAMKDAAAAADPSIVTSALVLFSATFVVGAISKVEIIGRLCIMLARGSIISALCILFLLPAILVALEPVIAHTSGRWNDRKPEKTEVSAE